MTSASETKVVISSRDANLRLDDFLRREGTKTFLAATDERNKARRSAIVLFWSVCAYVSIATLGEADRLKERERLASLADARVGALLEASAKVEQGELNALIKHNRATERVEELETNLGATTTASGALVDPEPVRPGQPDRQMEAALQQQVSQVQRDYTSAVDSERKARRNIEEFKLKDQQSRYEWDRRRASVPTTLAVALAHAQSLVEERRAALEKVRKAIALEPLDPEKLASTQDSPPKEPSRPSRNPTTNLRLLSQARQEQSLARTEFATVQHAKENAQTALKSALADRQRLDPLDSGSPIQLPILNLAVAPRLFAYIAPWLVVVLYVHVVLTSRNLTRSLRHLISDALVDKLSAQDLQLRLACASSISYSTWSQLIAIMPTVGAVATIALLMFDKFQTPSAVGVLLTLAIAAFQVMEGKKLRTSRN